ncbi:MAG: transcription-repair coupling factor, partial [Pseudonocardiales bacterium]|nr:transcription-repair coupling factor [Pseudonocardiales bacterium]
MPDLSGLLAAAVTDPGLAQLPAQARAGGARIQGPAALRPLVAATLASPDEGGPVLAVTATDREAEELTAALTDLIGPDAVASLPSWETLPHERLSPRSDTVGRRLTIFHRLAHPETDGELRVVVSAVRSL